MERTGADLISWPREGVTRVPYAVFSDREIYRREHASLLVCSETVSTFSRSFCV